MTLDFILSQGLVIFAAVCNIVSYFTKNHRLILIYRIVICACFAVSYFLLSAMAAVGTNALSILRMLVFYLFARKDKDCPLWLFIVFEISIVVTSVLMWDGLITLVLIGTTCDTLCNV